MTPYLLSCVGNSTETHLAALPLASMEDGRWIAEVPDLSGAMTYGQTREEAISRVKALALRVLADRLEQGESIPELRQVFEIAA